MAPSNKISGYVKDGLALTGLAAAAVVALPVLAVVALAARPLFLVAVAGSAVYAVAKPMMRRFSHVAVERPAGLVVPVDVKVHASHSWLREEATRQLVGVDELLQKVFGAVDAIELPAIGTLLEAGAPMLTLQRGTRRLQVRSPVSGRVCAVNEALRTEPGRMNRSPYCDGWMMQVESDGEPRGLRQGRDASAWMRAELDRLVAAVSMPGMTATMQDGGTLSDTFFANLDDESFERVAKALFAAEG